MTDIIHRIGSSIQNLVTTGGMVLTGIAMTCGKCRKACTISLPRAQFTQQSDLQGKTYFCPYCGAEGRVDHPGHIIDVRPVSAYD